MLISWGCRKQNAYKPSGLEQRKFILSHSGARSLKSRSWQGRAPCESSRGESFFVSSSFWWLLAVLGAPWHVAASIHSASIGTCLHLPVCFLTRALVVGLGPHVLTRLHMQKPCFQVRSRSEVAGGREFRGGCCPTQCGLATSGPAGFSPLTCRLQFSPG